MKLLFFIFLNWFSLTAVPIDDTCYFHIERKSELETEERGEKTQVSTACSGSLSSMASLISEYEGDLLDARHALEIILCRGAGLCNLDWDDPTVVEEWKKRTICEHHIKELLREWDHGTNSLHGYRTREGVRLCSIDPRLGPNHEKRPALTKRRRITMTEASVILRTKGILVHPGTYICRNHKVFINAIVAEYNRQSDAEVSSRRSDTPDEKSSSNWDGSDLDSSNPFDQRRFEMEAFLRWTNFLGETGVNRRGSKCYSTLGRSQKHEVRALSRRLLDKQCELMSNEDGKALLKDTCFGIEKEPLPGHKNYVHIMETVGEMFLKAGSREERLVILSLVALSSSNAEIRRYIPGISDYYCTEARKRALRTETVEEDRKRMRYNPQAVNAFIEFITGPSQMVGLPFGSRTITFSDGRKEQIISVVRKHRNSRIIFSYEEYLKETNQEHLKLSRSTMYRLLNICSASRQKKEACVDYFVADAEESMETVLDIIDNWKESGLIDGKEAQEWKRRLEEGHLYLRTDFRIHLKPQSRVGDHCLQHALTEKSSQSPCEQGPEAHEHDLLCKRCEQMKETISELKELVSKFVEEAKNSNDGTTQHMLETLADHSYSITQLDKDMTELKKHILRAELTQKQRQQIINELKAGEAFCVLDWAQKFLPLRHRETQSAYFGKKGISWHISHCSTIIDGKLHTHSFVHILEGSDSQDSASVTSITQDFLKELFSAGIRRVHLRSDNAGAYHSSSTVSSMHAITVKTGVYIAEVSFSESQDGKGPCDRVASHIKRRARDSIDSGMDADSAEGLFLAASHGSRLIGVSLHLGNIQNKKISDTKIKKISSLNYFYYGGAHMKASSYKGIGSTLDIPFGNLRPNQGTFKQSKEIRSEEFWKVVKYEKEACSETQDVADEEKENDDEKPESCSKLFECQVENCGKTFLRYSNLEHHMLVGNHKKNPIKETMQDLALGSYKEKLEGVSKKTISVVKDAIEEAVAQGEPVTPLAQGWAKQERKSGRFSDDAKEFLKDEFDKGWNAKEQKVNEKATANRMKTIRREDGTLRFKPEERLTTAQIKSYFSRLSSVYKKSGGPSDRDPLRKEDTEGDFNLVHLDNLDMEDDVFLREIHNKKSTVFAEEEQKEGEIGSAEKKHRYKFRHDDA